MLAAEAQGPTNPARGLRFSARQAGQHTLHHLPCPCSLPPWRPQVTGEQGTWGDCPAARVINEQMLCMFKHAGVSAETECQGVCLLTASFSRENFSSSMSDTDDAGGRLRNFTLVPSEGNEGDEADKEA